MGPLELICKTPLYEIVAFPVFVVVANLFNYLWSRKYEPYANYWVEVFSPIQSISRAKRYFFKGPGFLHAAIAILIGIALGKMVENVAGEQLKGFLCG